MQSIQAVLHVLLRLGIVAGFALVLLVPASWAAGRIQDGKSHPFFRLLLAAGLALMGFVSFVNLVGRLTQSSTIAVLLCLAVNLLAAFWLFRRRPHELGAESLRPLWRSWAGPLLLALVLGVPQWFAAVSTPYWDETASSAIQLTGPNQFAEGVFPPRHNAFPDLPAKYHYGFMILSGTLRWLTGLPANMTIDIASTALWIFVFLFVWFWFRDLDFGRVPSSWAAFATLLGGSLAWLYLPRIEAYENGGYTKNPTPSQLSHAYDATKGWLSNVLSLGEAPSLHMRNTNGTLSNLPWDVAAQFQQHAVAIGIALIVVALYLFTTWQARRDFHLPLLLANVATFGVLFLAHAVFGGVAAVTAGLCLLGAWLRERTRTRFVQGLCFTAGVAALAFLHGGMLARGARYGAAGLMTLRAKLGYASGGFFDLVNWGVAGFGVPLLLAIVAWYGVLRSGTFGEGRRGQLLSVLTVLTLFSGLVPQLVYYSSWSKGPEEYTEISKFFFCTHLGLALLSAFGIARLKRPAQWVVLGPGLVAMAIMPLAFCRAAAVGADSKWLGFYESPYVGKNHVEVQTARQLARLKKTPRDVYFDGSGDERRSGYLGAMLIYGGSVFSVTPTRYERNGVGYRISPDVVAHRILQSGRMSRLLPGAPEEAGCTWYLSRSSRDVTLWPVIVRSRFDKLVGEGYLVQRFEAGVRELYSFERETKDLDQDIGLHWQPRIVVQADWNADHQGRLVFYDPAGRRILRGDESIALPEALGAELVQVSVATLSDEPRLSNPQSVDLLLARMADSDYRVGARTIDIVEDNDWMWTRWDGASGAWQPEAKRWSWIDEIPLVADVDGSGVDVQVGYRPATGEWLSASGGKLNGPTIPAEDLGIPFSGRFLQGSTADLGLWSMKTGMVTLRSLTTGQVEAFRWGGRAGDVLVPGDYDGDGVDELAVWQRTNTTWYWRRLDGSISQATFGSPACIPTPADYDHDGRVDLGCWEPREAKILVSLKRDGTLDLTVPVPPHGIPAFVNWY